MSSELEIQLAEIKTQLREWKGIVKTMQTRAKTDLEILDNINAQIKVLNGRIREIEDSMDTDDQRQTQIGALERF